jgi:KRAB domain-containing zinc finger protein
MENYRSKIKLEPENDYENSSKSQREIFLQDQKVKKDPEGNFLLLPFISPKMPKSIKREVTRKVINSTGGKPTKFSEFQCKICERYLANKEILSRHRELHFQPSSFKCEKCERVFTSNTYLKIHKCVKVLEGKYFCEFCQRSFNLFSNLNIHKRKLHADELKVDWLHCDSCDMKFMHKSRLKNHLKSFKCKIKKVFCCDYCGKEFEERPKIFKHVRDHAIPLAECKVCEARVKNLNFHIKTVHKSEKVECKICGSFCKNRAILKVHQELHESKRLPCHFCHLTFQNRGKLNYHMKFHENPEQFKCQICGHQKTSKGQLKDHLKTHDVNRDKKFKCDQCDFQNDRKVKFVLHLTQHEKLNEKFRKFPTAVKCEKCFSVLKDGKAYEKHVKLMHENHPTLKCNICGKELRAKIYLKKHQKLHQK